MGLLATIGPMAESDSARGPDESLPWSLLPEPPGLTALEAAMRDLDEVMQPSTTMVESVRLLESASLGIYDVANAPSMKTTSNSRAVRCPPVRTTWVKARSSHDQPGETKASGAAAC